MVSDIISLIWFEHRQMSITPLRDQRIRDPSSLNLLRVCGWYTVGIRLSLSCVLQIAGYIVYLEWMISIKTGDYHDYELRKSNILLITDLEVSGGNALMRNDTIWDDSDICWWVTPARPFDTILSLVCTTSTSTCFSEYSPRWIVPFVVCSQRHCGIFGIMWYGVCKSFRHGPVLPPTRCCRAHEITKAVEFSLSLGFVIINRARSGKGYLDSVNSVTIDIIGANGWAWSSRQIVLETYINDVWKKFAVEIGHSYWYCEVLRFP